MRDVAAIQSSVGNITAMFAGCAFIFGAMVFRVLPRILPNVSDSDQPKDQLILSVKMIAMAMAIPILTFLGVIVGGFPVLWYASRLWCCFVGSLIIALAALIFSLFWLDREDVEDYTIELDRRAAIDTRMKKEDAEKRIVVIGFGLWILGLGASYLWLLHLASMSVRDVLAWF